MRTRFAWTRTLVALATTLFLFTASAADRPVKRNKDFNPAAANGAFPFVTTGVAVKIKSANITNDGQITARFTMTDSKG